jgi:hypothetical protein
MNRQQRRAAAAKHRHRVKDGDVIFALDRDGLVRTVATMVGADETLGGATLIMGTGETIHFDAATLRRGGGRA